MTNVGSAGSIQAPLTLVILKSLTEQERHGYDIIRWVRVTTDQILQVGEGSLYPTMHRLEEIGWISSTWGRSENNRRAKYYTITRSGTKHLREEADKWRLLTQAVARILSSPTD